MPDSVLDEAEIELVDLPPGELLKRLAEGKVYVPDRAQAAAQNFFREGNLIALRELALRVAAEHVGQNVRDYLAARHITGPWKSGQRLLVAVSPSPLSESMARWTRRLADNLQSPWLAVFVDTGRRLSDDEQARLQKNLALARELGAEVITTSDSDLVEGILRIARQQNVTQIVVGKPAGFRLLDFLRGGSVLSRLIRDSGNIDVCCVRAETGEAAVAPAPLRWRPSSAPRQYLAALGVVAGVTALNFALRNWTGPYALSLVYLMAVVVLALFVGRGPIYLAATASALMWNYCFLPPLYTFYITSFQDALMFIMFFVVALAMGHLTGRLRAQESAEREREERATALYLLTRELAGGKDFTELLGVVIRQLGEVFQADVAVLLPDADRKADLVPYPFGTLDVSEKEAGVAAWAFRNAKPAGCATDTLPFADGLYMPLATPTGCVGVIGLRLKKGRELQLQQRNLLENFIRQIALVLDRQRLSDADHTAKLLEESERLSKALLDSISHELRTPIAAITSAASGLEEPGVNPGLRRRPHGRNPRGQPAAEPPRRQPARHDAARIRPHDAAARMVRRGRPRRRGLAATGEGTGGPSGDDGPAARTAAGENGFRADGTGADEPAGQRRAAHAGGNPRPDQCRRRKRRAAGCPWPTTDRASRRTCCRSYSTSFIALPARPRAAAAWGFPSSKVLWKPMAATSPRRIAPAAARNLRSVCRWARRRRRRRNPNHDNDE